MNILQLPNDILTYILALIPLENTLEVKQTCKQFNKLYVIETYKDMKIKRYMNKVIEISLPTKNFYNEIYILYSSNENDINQIFIYIEKNGHNETVKFLGEYINNAKYRIKINTNTTNISINTDIQSIMDAIDEPNIKSITKT